MSHLFPDILKKKAMQWSIRMPQIMSILPAGYSLTFRQDPPNGMGWVYTGFQVGGQLVGGGVIPPYDQFAGTGLRWRAHYFNKDPIKSVHGGWRYFTNDYLYQQVEYGPRLVTDFVRATLVNDLAVPVEIAFTVFRFEIPLVDIFSIFGDED